MKVEKSIDLGKLQNDLLKARALLNAASNEVDSANGAYQSAIKVVERATAKHKKAREAVDMTQRAMLEAARTVASS